MAFDFGEDRDDGEGDCPICGGSGLIFELVPMLDIDDGPMTGCFTLRKACAACAPEMGSCTRCAGFGYFSGNMSFLCTEGGSGPMYHATVECGVCRND